MVMTMDGSTGARRSSHPTTTKHGTDRTYAPTTTHSCGRCVDSQSVVTVVPTPQDAKRERERYIYI